MQIFSLSYTPLHRCLTWTWEVVFWGHDVASISWQEHYLCLLQFLHSFAPRENIKGPNGQIVKSNSLLLNCWSRQRSKPGVTLERKNFPCEQSGAVSSWFSCPFGAGETPWVKQTEESRSYSPKWLLRRSWSVEGRGQCRRDLSSGSNSMVTKQTSHLPDIVIWLHLCHKMLFVVSEMAGHTHKRAEGLRRDQPHSICDCCTIAGGTCTSTSLCPALWWNDGCLHLTPFGFWSRRWSWRLEH